MVKVGCCGVHKLLLGSESFFDFKQEYLIAGIVLVVRGGKMITKLREAIKSVSGFEGIITEAESIDDIDPNVARVDIFNFKLDGVLFKCTQIIGPLITVNMIDLSFRFPTTKKAERAKLYSLINSFNKTKIGMKSVLEEVDKDYFQVNFSVEFFCPDGNITIGMVHPSVKILRTSSRLMLASMGGHGIPLKDAKKND